MANSYRKTDKRIPIGQYWAICVAEGLVGFAYAHYFNEATIIAESMLTILDVPPQVVAIIPIGPRLFAVDKIETGDC